MPDLAEQSATPVASVEEKALADGTDATAVDFGFGHPAHRPDPAATYAFDPGPPRTLPLNPERRWRLPG